MDEYLISVIMPAHNSAETIAQSIESVINQTYSNFELLIFDDGSTDLTKNIIEKYITDPRVFYFSLGCNVGVCEARNYLINKSKGRFIAFLDSDDLWLDFSLRSHMDFMVENRVSFSFMNYSRISYSGEILSNVKAPDCITYNDLLKSNKIGCLTVCLDRTAFDSLLFPVLKCSEDYALWLELLKTGVVAKNVGCIGALYRLSRGSRSSNKLRTIKWQWIILREREKISVFSSVLCMFSYAVGALLKRI